MSIKIKENPCVEWADDIHNGFRVVGGFGKDPQMGMAEDFVSCVSRKIINQREINGKILLT